jgi:solute carrier family 25 protein 39/40
MQTRLQAQAAGVLYHQPAQMAALGPDAVRNSIHSVLRCVWFEFAVAS